MDLNKVKESSNDLEQLKKALIVEIGNIQKDKDNLQDRELVYKLIMFISLLAKSNNIRDELIVEMAKMSLFSEDMVKNISKTAGSTSDIFINEFGKHSEEVLETKLGDVKQKVENFSLKVGKKLEEEMVKNKKRNNSIIHKIKEMIVPIKNKVENSMGKIISNFIVSIIGGLVAIQIYQFWVIRVLG